MALFLNLSQSLLCAVALLALALAAWHDVATRLIPNWLSVLVLVCGLGLRLLQGDALVGLVAGGVVLAGAAALWFAGWLGGGDVKLMASGAVLIPPSAVLEMLLAIAVFGGVLAAGYIALRGWLRGRAPVGARRAGPVVWPRIGLGLPRRLGRIEAWRIRRGGPLPYGVAIGMGAACILVGG